jgi:hypothetical protein
VIGSIALGVGPLPFLGVYSVLFIIHGMFYPVQPPDITTTQTGEAVAGWIALALFCFGVLTIFWFLGGSRRWPFVIGQLATFGTSLDFILDPTKGSPAVPVLLLATSGVALVLAMLPASWDYVGYFPPSLPRWGRASPARVDTGASVSREVVEVGADAPGGLVEASDLPT